PTGKGTLQYLGGPVISNINVVLVLSRNEVRHAAELVPYYMALAGSPYIEWLSEYNTPSQSIGTGSLLYALIKDPLYEAKPNTPYTILDDAEHIRPFFLYMTKTGQISPTENTYYPFHIHGGVTVTKSGEKSCLDFCSYHGAIDLSEIGYSGAKYLYYAVIVDVGDPSCTPCKPGKSSLEHTLVAASGELAGAIVNPTNSKSLGWADPIYGTMDDICEGEVGFIELFSVKQAVQKQWSNQLQQCIVSKKLNAKQV
ncbi:hypothetical protein HDV05_001122, partial [Chytridiales sp. JEL 0842]